MVDNSIAIPAIYTFITLFIGWSRNVSIINLDRVLARSKKKSAFT
jgi:hypothetical protein